MRQGFDEDFAQILNDVLVLYKSDGRVFPDVRAHVSPQGILIMDVSLPIEVGDKLTRTLQNGLQDEFIVDNPSYQQGLAGVPPRFVVTVHRAAIGESRPKEGMGEPSGRAAAAVFGGNRAVTVVRHAGTPQETRWNTRMGGDFLTKGLFLVQDQIETCDEIHCELLAEPLVVVVVDPVVIQSGVSHWAAAIVLRSEWNRLHGTDTSRVAPGTWLAPRYPRIMYHATQSPVKVSSSQEEAALGPQWSRYIQGPYPKWKYHWGGESVIVKDLQEEIELGGGWANYSDEFEPYKGPRRARPERDDPTKWVDEWSVPGLSSEHRRRIKAKLLRAHSTFWKSPDAPSADCDSMRLAFAGIAAALFDAGILTAELLKNEIPLLVWDSAIAGGWWRYASELPPVSIFPERLGHYWVWRDDNKDWPGVFRSEQAEWRARLLDVGPTPSAASVPPAGGPQTLEPGSMEAETPEPVPAEEELPPPLRDEPALPPSATEGEVETTKFPRPTGQPAESSQGSSTPTEEQAAWGDKMVAERQDVDILHAAWYLRCSTQHVRRLIRKKFLTASNTKPKRIKSDSLRLHKWGPDSKASPEED